MSGRVTTYLRHPSLKNSVCVARGVLEEGSSTLHACSMAGGWPLEGPRFLLLHLWSCSCCFGGIEGDVSLLWSKLSLQAGEGCEHQPGLQEEGFVLALLLEMMSRNLLRRCT